MSDLAAVIARQATGTYTVTRRAGSAYGSDGRLDSPTIQTAWAGSTVYTLGAKRANGGKVYQVTTAGTSAASGGPTGTGSSIVDGSVTWKYISTAATTFSITASVQPLTGRDLMRLSEADRAEEKLMLFTSTRLNTVSQGAEADSVSINSETWEVENVEDYYTLGGYFRVRVSKVGK